MSRTVFRVTFEGDDPPTRDEVSGVLREEFEWDEFGVSSVTVEEQGRLRGIDGGSAASKRENR